MFYYRIDSEESLKNIVKNGYFAKLDILYSNSFMEKKQTPKLYFFVNKDFALNEAKLQDKYLIRFKSELLTDYNICLDKEFFHDTVSYYAEFDIKLSNKTIIKPSDIDIFDLNSHKWFNILNYNIK